MELKEGKKRRETEVKGCLRLSFPTSSIIPHRITLFAIELFSHLPLSNAVEEHVNNAQTSFSEAGLANRRICALTSEAQRERLTLSVISYWWKMYVCSSQIEQRDPTTDMQNQSITFSFQVHRFRTTV